MLPTDDYTPENRLTGMRGAGLLSLLLLVAGCGVAAPVASDAGSGADDVGVPDDDAQAPMGCVAATGPARCVVDPGSGLTWEDHDLAAFCSQSAATDYCEALSVCGASDWRVPTIDELRSLIRGCPGSPPRIIWVTSSAI